MLVPQLCLTLCKPMDCGPQGSSVHGILQARVLEWIAIPFSRGSFQPRYETWVSCIAGRFFTIWATEKIQYTYMHIYIYAQALLQKKSFSDVCSFIKSKLEIFWWRQKCIWIVWARFPGKDWDTNLHKLRSALINISDRTREARLRKRRTVQFQIRSSKTHIHHQNYSPWTTSKVLELPKEGVTGGWLLLAQFAQIALWQFPGRLHSEQQVANTPRKWGNAFWNEVGGTL